MRRLSRRWRGGCGVTVPFQSPPRAVLAGPVPGVSRLLDADAGRSHGDTGRAAYATRDARTEQAAGLYPSLDRRNIRVGLDRIRPWPTPACALLSRLRSSQRFRASAGWALPAIPPRALRVTASALAATRSAGFRYRGPVTRKASLTRGGGGLLSESPCRHPPPRHGPARESCALAVAAAGGADPTASACAAASALTAVLRSSAAGARAASALSRGPDRAGCRACICGGSAAARTGPAA